MGGSSYVRSYLYLRVLYRGGGGEGVHWGSPPPPPPPPHKFENYGVIIASTATIGSIIIDLMYYS